MATDGVNLASWRSSLEDLRSDFKANAVCPCRAWLLHYATPSVEIPSDWSQRPDDGGHRPTKTRQLMMEGRRRFSTAPDGKGYVTAWKRHLELFGDATEIQRVYSLSGQASELLWSLDDAVSSDPWVYRFTPKPFQYVTPSERWFGTVFELAWHENKSSRLRAPRWTWSPVGMNTRFALRNGDAWGGLSPESLPTAFSQRMFAEEASLAAKCGWWCSEIDNFALASAQAIDLILSWLDGAADIPSAATVSKVEGPFGVNGFAFQGKRIDRIPNLPWKLLDTLWKAPGRTLVFDEIVATVWGDPNEPVSNRTIQSHCATLRKLFRNNGIPCEIRTGGDPLRVELLM